MLIANNEEIKNLQTRLHILKDQLNNFKELEKYAGFTADVMRKIADTVNEIKLTEEIIRSVDGKDELLRKMKTINEVINGTLLPKVVERRKILEAETKDILLKLNRIHI